MSKTILIAEDEAPLAKALSLKLSASGFKTVIATNGAEALQCIESEKPSLLVLDIMMPEIDGYGVLEELKKKNQSIPVIVISNLSQNEDKKRVLELGAKEYFVKSDTQLSEIVDFINKMLK